MGPAEIIFI